MEFSRRTLFEKFAVDPNIEDVYQNFMKRGSKSPRISNNSRKNHTAFFRDQ